MDLYKFHSKPSKLLGNHEAKHIVPSRILAKVTRSSKETERQKKILARDPHNAYEYASSKRQPFPEGEDAIAKDPYLAYNYARNITKKPFLKGEDAIAKEPVYAYYYAVFLNKRFEKGEKGILGINNNDSYNNYICEYAQNILKKRWPEGEKVLLQLKNAENCYHYAFKVIKGPWPDAENIIAEDIDSIMKYVKYVTRERFPKGEDVIKKSGKYDRQEYYELTGIKL